MTRKPATQPVFGVPGTVFVISRNASDRPACIHWVTAVGDDVTLCGVPMDGWSREYAAWYIEVLLCKKETCRS